jgi:hypothetical protein
MMNEDLAAGIRKLDAHIAEMAQMESWAEQLRMETDPIRRYLAGLRQARELVTGIKDHDTEDAPEDGDA